jgi:hypothetical protein
MNSRTVIEIDQAALDSLVEQAALRAAQLALERHTAKTGELWTARRVAEHFGVTTRTVRNRVRAGKLPMPVNGRWKAADILGVKD